jgi:hypothetical protein
MSPDENVAEEQADEQIEEEQNPISSKIDWYDELISAKITPDDEDERDMIEDELWKIIIDDLNQILTSTEYPHDSLNEPIEYPSEDWNTNATKFREAFEYQCANAILAKLFGPSRNRDSIEIQSNLGTGDEGVDGWILQSDPDFKHFGLTIIQSKLHEPTETGFPVEPQDTADKAASAARKVRNDTEVGNAAFKDMQSKVQALTTELARDIPIYSIIVTSKSSDGDYQTICDDENIHSIDYSLYVPILESKTTTHTNIPDWAIENELLTSQDETEVNLAILPASVIYEFIHEGNGKRNDSVLSYNVRMDLQTSKNSKKKTRAIAIRKSVDTTLSEHPEKFLAFNNGLVIYHIGAPVQDGDSYTFKESMIVNGGQTLQAILDYGWKNNPGNPEESLDKVFVVTKFVGVDSHETDTPEGANAANSQNPVEIDDLLANNPDLINMQEWLKSRPEHARVFLELKEGQTQSGLIDLGDYTFKKSLRDFTKESWIRYALAAAGVAYKQSAHKEMIWESYSIQVAFNPGTKVSAIPSASREGVLQNGMWDDYIHDERDVAETVLMARTVHQIFDQIKSVFKTRTNKTSIPDDELREEIKDQAGILGYLPYIGTSLFFKCVHIYSGDDLDKRKELLTNLFNGEMFQPTQNSQGQQRPSFAMFNAFVKSATTKKWLNVKEGQYQQWQPLDDQPFTEKAVADGTQNLVTWCWNIAKTAVKVYSENFNHVIRDCTQDKSSDYLQAIVTILLNEVPEDKYPKEVSIQEPDEDVAAEENVEDPSCADILNQAIELHGSVTPNSLKKAKIQLWLDLPRMQADEAKTTREGLEGLLLEF